MKAFVIDLSRCNGCHNCQIVCKDEHVGNAWPPYAAPQPDTGQFWVRVDERVHGSTPKVKIEYMPLLCNHCEHPACVDAAKNGAAYRRDDGLVIIDPEKAKGQKAIADACPYGAVYWNEALALPQKCTGCAHLLDDGWEEPRCVEACATEALRFIEEEQIARLYPNAAPLDDACGCGPRAYYANAPKKFVAGTVFDPKVQEVVVDATITLFDGEGKKLGSAKTDGFGDFWFRSLDDGRYRVRVEAEGFQPISFEDVAIGESRNLGDIPLARM